MLQAVTNVSRDRVSEASVFAGGEPQLAGRLWKALWDTRNVPSCQVGIRRGHMTSFESAVDRRVWRARERGRDWNRFENRGRSPVGRLIVGSLIALWGFSLLLANLGLGDLHRVWPAVMVVVGVTLLIHRDPSRNHHAFWGTMWMAAGVLLYAAQQTWIHVSFWPVILIVIGASFVYRGLTHTGK
jgi:hypothetical protein